MRSDIEQRIDPAEANPSVATGLDLLPISIIALGSPAQPVERLMWLQSATAKAVDLVTSFRFSALRRPLPGWLRLRAQ